MVPDRNKIQLSTGFLELVFLGANYYYFPDRNTVCVQIISIENGAHSNMFTGANPV